MKKKKKKEEEIYIGGPILNEDNDDNTTTYTRIMVRKCVCVWSGVPQYIQITGQGMGATNIEQNG